MAEKFLSSAAGKRGLMLFAGLILSAAIALSGKPAFSGSGETAAETRATPKVEARAEKEAMFYSKLKDNFVRCLLCPNKCTLPEGSSGIGRMRKNIKGKLYAMSYGKPCSVSLEPIEKAPLYHFKPGHKRLALATVGCNLSCIFCQNWYISQKGPGEVTEYDAPPEQIVEEALRQGAESICFTFSEPSVFYEYVYDISRLAKEKGLMTSIVSNGFINPEPLRQLLPYLDAVKIDLKAFSEKFYRKVTGGELEAVLNTLKLLKEENAHFEIVNLIIPTLNDSPEEIAEMCAWIKENLGDDVPLHFSRFSPTYKLTTLPPTPVRTLEDAIKIADDAGLKYVYIGNVPGHKRNSTNCPRCGKTLISRRGFSVTSNNLKDGKCKFCGLSIPGIWE